MNGLTSDLSQRSAAQCHRCGLTDFSAVLRCAPLRSIDAPQNMYIGGFNRMAYLGICTSLTDPFLRRACQHIETVAIEMESIERVDAGTANASANEGGVARNLILPYTPLAGAAMSLFDGHGENGFVHRWSGTPTVPDQVLTCFDSDQVT